MIILWVGLKIGNKRNVLMSSYYFEDDYNNFILNISSQFSVKQQSNFLYGVEPQSRGFCSVFFGRKLKVK